jgi:hypothetical protein
MAGRQLPAHRHALQVTELVIWVVDLGEHPAIDRGFAALALSPYYQVATTMLHLECAAQLCINMLLVQQQAGDRAL